MYTRTQTIWAMLPFALFAKMAFAFVDVPTITPLYPRVGEVVSLNIRAGGCDYYNGEDHAYPEITRIGNAIRIVVRIEREMGSCNSPAQTTVLPVGSFSAGTYTLQVDRLYVPDWFSPEEVIETQAMLPFVVGASAPIPALDWSGLIALAAVLSAMAGSAFQRSS